MELNDVKRVILRELLLAPSARMIEPPDFAPEMLALLVDQTIDVLLRMGAAPPVPEATRQAFRATADSTRDATLRKLGKAALGMLDVIECELTGSVIHTLAETGISREQLQAMLPLLRRITATDRHGWTLPAADGVRTHESPVPTGAGRQGDPRTVPVAKFVLDVLIRTAGYDPRQVAVDQDTTGRFEPLLRAVLDLLDIPGDAKHAKETAILAWVASGPE